MLFFVLRIPRPPRSTLTDTLFPYTTLFRSRGAWHRPRWHRAWAESRLPPPAARDHAAQVPVPARPGCSGRSGPPEPAPGPPPKLSRLVALLTDQGRSEDQRVGTECVSTCRSRWSPAH